MQVNTDSVHELVESFDLPPGNYVVAVSGGVDSVTLLHLLHRYITEYSVNNLPKLTVAHYDHGIRGDSHYDRKIVQEMARKLGLPFVYEEGNLGAGASEALAREHRYAFLRKVQRAAGASGIITAHHKDDAVETAVINISRGTGRRGITSLRDLPHMRRPLLHINKSDLVNYAKQQGLLWREDSTNKNTAIFRNYIRSKLKNHQGTKQHGKLIEEIKRMRSINNELDNLIELYLHSQQSRRHLSREQFSLLPHDLSLEVMAEWLRNQNITTFNSKLLENLVIKCKTLSSGKQIDIDDNNKIVVEKDDLVLVS